MSETEPQKEIDNKQLTLTYEKEDWTTHEKIPVEITIGGNDEKDLYQKALQHLIGLEMDENSSIATSTKVKIDGQEMSWKEFELQANK